jgi:hypothetical protein
VSGIITDGESAPGTFTGAISGNTLQITAIVNDGSVSSKTMTKKGSTGNGGGGGSTDILDGTVWEQLTGDVPPGGSRLSFNSPNFEFTVITNGTVYAAGPYTVTGNSVSGTVTDGEAAPGTFTGAISGNTLQYTAIWYNGETSSGTMTRKGSTGGGGGDLSGEPGDGGNTGGGGGGEPGTDGGGALAEAKGKLTLTGFTQFNGNYVYSTLTTASGKTLGGINGVNSDGGFIYMVPISGGTAEVPLYYRESRMVPYEDSDTIQAVSIYLVNEAFGKFFSGDLKSMYENYVALIRNNTSNTSFTPSTTNGSITINRSDIMTLHEINVSEDEDRYTVMQTAKYILWVNP